MCNSADSFVAVNLDCFPTNGSSCHAAVLHEINKEIVVLLTYFCGI